MQPAWPSGRSERFWHTFETTARHQSALEGGDMRRNGRQPRMLALAAGVVACALATFSGRISASPAISDAEFPLSLAVDPNHVDPVLTNTVQANNIEQFFAQTLTTYIFT